MSRKTEKQNEVKFSERDFRKASFCRPGLACVEVAHKEGLVKVRDSKDPSSSALSFTHAEWSAFLQGVKNNEFEC